MAPGDDNDDRYRRYSHIPIPTYDEATAVRPSTSQTFRGPGEISDDAERQGLLLPSAPTGAATAAAAYRPPTVESPRSSADDDGDSDADSDLRLPEVTGEGEDERRRVEELDYLDPATAEAAPRLYHRARLRSKFSQRLSDLGASLSAIRLPSFRSLYAPVATRTSTAEEVEEDEAAIVPPRRSWLLRPSCSVPSIPEQYRMSAATAARLCGLLTIAILVYALFALDVFPGRGRYPGTRFDPESVRSYVQDNVDAGRIEEYLSHLAAYDHVAGTAGDLYMAEWMKERWQQEGNLDDVALHSYLVYLNYPTAGGRSVSIVRPDDKKWVARLEEDIAAPGAEQTLAWFGNSKSGEAEGHLVYANGGSLEDFAWLREHNVALNGSIALMRLYNTQADRALKVKAAAEAGCVGALLFADPADDGAVKGPVWPDGPWRPESSLQRGDLALSGLVLGDPLTPGHASTLDAQRISRESSDALTQIPALPLAWRDAKVLIAALHSRGRPVPREWIGGDPAADTAAEWFSGDDSADAPVVHVKNVNDENEKQPIWNLHGLIEGVEQSEKRVFVGSHRDAWCFGAVDAGSASAVLMEMVQIFGQLRRLGWRPLRSIEFVNWDATEYNFVGSTEYVEEHLAALRDHAVAYLNVGVGVYGPDPKFHAAGSPMWQRALTHVLDRVGAPGTSATLQQLWQDGHARLCALGADGDHVAFQHMAGTSSLDFGFAGAPHAYPQHSCFDSLDWMRRFGDSGFHWHRTLAQVWALLILEVADRPLLPFDLRVYAETIRGPALDTLQQFATNFDSPPDLSPLHAAASRLADVAAVFHRFEDVWTAQVLATGGLENNHFARRRLDYNARLTGFERELLMSGDDAEGKQFLHILSGPPGNGSTESVSFPTVREAMNKGNREDAAKAVAAVAETLNRAIDHLT